MSGNKRIDQPTGTETVGHEWDGIEELNTPLPRWWLWSFYACIAFAIGYCFLYPSVPGANGATGGLFKWSSRDQLQKELNARDAELNQVRQALVAADIHKLEGNEQLMQEAIAGGAAAFKVYCVQCHGAGAAGSKGYPNLNDDDWLWGGDLATIEKTITDGIRQPNHVETRYSQMPAFGKDGLLQPAQIEDVTSFIRVISRQEKPSASSRRGQPIFEANCAICHGPEGHGDRMQGAPNLADAIWLYGGDRASISQTIANSRFGVMPAWGLRLDKATIRMLAAYVHSLGGGEAMPEAEMAADTTSAEEGNVGEQ
ncbi:MAG: cytochrome-c oxidase, cbb3-type subunit III [Sphingobium sp.]